MPLYEYYCPPCGSQFEVLRPMSQMDVPAVCPSGHTTNNRVLSMFAISRGAMEGGMTAAEGCGIDGCCSTEGMMGGLGGCSCC